MSLQGIQFVDMDAESTTNNIITVYEGLSGRSLFPGDPVRVFLTSLAQIIVQQRVLINDAASQSLLRYARGDVLDDWGYTYRADRLQAVPAQTTLQFTLSIPLTSASIIPEGTRVSPDGSDGDLFFITDKLLEIPAGQTQGSIKATCSVAGNVGNGFTSGQVNTLIDPLPFVSGVVNTSISSGGADAENDNAYRERIRTAPESFSVAGPDGAYRYWAFAASQLIVDVSVTSPSDGVVLITPLLTGGELPTQELLDKILDICDPKDKRPLTDHVTVSAPVVRSFDIDLTYWIDINNSASAVAIQTAVNDAVQEYILWQKSKLGRNINPSELTRLVMQAGAYRVDIISPTYTAISFNEVAIADQVTVTYGGLTDD